MRKYFIVEGYQRKGPYTVKELINKNITEDTLIWTFELGKEKPASQIQELKEIFGDLSKDKSDMDEKSKDEQKEERSEEFQEIYEQKLKELQKEQDEKKKQEELKKQKEKEKTEKEKKEEPIPLIEEASGKKTDDEQTEEEVETEITGKVRIKKIYNVTDKGSIAGGYVFNGKIKIGDKVDVLRNGNLIHKGVVSSLQYYGNNVNEVKQNYECGLIIDNYKELKQGDILELYVGEGKQGVDEKITPQTKEKEYKVEPEKKKTEIPVIAGSDDDKTKKEDLEPQTKPVKKSTAEFQSAPKKEAHKEYYSHKKKQHTKYSAADKPKSYLILAIIVTLFCCLPFGIVSITFASQVEKKFKAGDITGAQIASRNSLVFSIIGMVSAFIFWIIIVATQ